MSQSRVFTLIGDSNLRRHMSPLNCRDRPLMSGAQHLSCGRIEVLPEALASIREESNVLIVACITNFLTASTDDPSSIALRVEPVIQDFLSKLLDFGSTRPELQILVCAPMYRRQPIWYREGLPEIITKFSSVLSPMDRINLMPSFPTPSFEADGIHLTPYSGLEYVLHLFDSALSVLDALTQPVEVSVKRSVESSRVLEDRMMTLEQDHLRLNGVLEMKTAVDAELVEYHQNVSFEHFVTIAGLKRCSTGLDPKEWQVEAKEVTGALLSRLMQRSVPIVFVKNSTSRRPGAETRYHVQLQSVAESKSIRDKFSTFFPGSKDERPKEYKGISIRNRLTQETRIRIAIMQVIAHRYRDSNPEGKAQVIHFESRPILKITPLSDGERWTQSYFYIDAVKKFPTCLTSEELKPILSMIGAEQKGKVRSLFIVISDDMIKRTHPQSSSEARDESGPSSGVSAAEVTSGRSGKSGHKRGASVSPTDDASRKKNKGRSQK